MIEDEFHFVAMSIDAAHAAAEGRDQIIHRREQNIGQDRSFEMPPQPLNQIETWAVRWQPIDFDFVPVGVQPRPNRLGVVERAIVADQAHFAAAVSGGHINIDRERLHFGMDGVSGSSGF